MLNVRWWSLIIWMTVHDPAYIYYVSSYARNFEHNAEDAVLGSLPSGRYRIVFNDNVGVHERWVDVEAGKLTEVYFVVK